MMQKIDLGMVCLVLAAKDEASKQGDNKVVKKETRMHFHGRLTYNIIERMACECRSDTRLSRLVCVTCARTKHTKNAQSKIALTR